eukprot:CAMPEP_0198363542 /NCGR_PEP_ID=MMETSP1450-20131203/150160_1 /TAXON_ID=753684 ORGANISM="Madagascaria erythrocladiodes, Strain CCMP3234" /NCGR_SAMPLE_ID=MMETSP1450 /ASSEMBLY_ACC=CAM_ASM_001115 /LENGTH=69 /DNA_ID=CAMNT_0044070885 /DNA_START=21 /DNA_END=227 /DNA_ORIENTATION=-
MPVFVGFKWVRWSGTGCRTFFRMIARRPRDMGDIRIAVTLATSRSSRFGSVFATAFWDRTRLGPEPKNQ